MHWLETNFPGQVQMRMSARPLLFMASCFARSLDGVDLIVHEYAVNGGGRMLCLQERILRAAYYRSEQPAVLVLLWLAKYFRPPSPGSQATDSVHKGLDNLAAHYDYPTLSMPKAFAAHCPPNRAWCYERDMALGGEGSLHSDGFHPNRDGHFFFAAHILELFERSARAVSAGFAPRETRPAAVPLEPLLDLNTGLDATSEGGSNLCLDVDDMVFHARTNSGWERVEEVTKAQIRRVPALLTERLGAAIEWQLDLRGVIWVIVTYMQSYTGFATARVDCGGGCACRMLEEQASADVHGAQAAMDMDAVVHRYVNATSPTTKTSEPQWRILEVTRSSPACTVRVTTVSPGKFKLMLLSLVRVARTSADPADPASPQLLQQSSREKALQCFGVALGKHGHGLSGINDRVNMDALTMDDSRYWQRRVHGARPSSA